MASYQLMKQTTDEGNLYSPAKDCSMRIEPVQPQDIESALHKVTPSPRLRSSSDVAANAAAATSTSSPSSRLASLDVFRGLTVAIMILVDEAGGIVPSINHSPWNGLTLADFVMPFFLFMVGVSLGLTYKNLSCKAAASKKALWRTIKLLVLGIFLQGGFFHGINNLTYGVDMGFIRWMGVLQRIAVAYWVTAMCEIWLRNNEKVSCGLSLLKKYQKHWAVMFMLTTVYILLLYGTYVPDWEYKILNEASTEADIFRVKCGVRGDTSPACNAVGMIDRMVLGVEHLYRKPIYARTKQCSINSPASGPLPPGAPSWCQAPFDPEGLLSTVMAIVTTMIGLQYGHVIIHFKDHKNRLVLWLSPSVFLIFIGTLCDMFGMHVNKAMYTLSYTCVSAGVAGVLLTTIYLVVDVYGWKRYTLAVRWMGTNALLLYIIVACNILPLILQGFYWKDPHNNILTLIGIGGSSP